MSARKVVREMQKRRLGRTNLQVSVVGFGGIPIVQSSISDAVRMLRRAYDLGINYFDTARAYGNGEEKYGLALAEIRDNVVIATKTHQRTREDAARAGLKQSLRNLRTDRIDIVMLHGIDDEKTLEQATGNEGSLSALKEARSQGKLDFIGMSGHRPLVLAKAIRTGEFDVILVPFNIINREASEELFSLAKELDIGVVVMKPFGGINLSFAAREMWAERVPEKAEFTHILGEGSLKAERCLRYVLAHDVHTMVPGFSSLEEVESAAKVGNEFTGLTEQEKTDFKFGKLPPAPFCRECGLCLPCPDGVNIPLILGLDKYYSFFGIRNWSREVYERLSTKVDSCSKCMKCEPKCPYKLPIIEMLNQANNRLAK
jgi:predicted aldo/keto reductase-like oxidoreductase